MTNIRVRFRSDKMVSNAAHWVSPLRRTSIYQNKLLMKKIKYNLNIKYFWEIKTKVSSNFWIKFDII